MRGFWSWLPWSPYSRLNAWWNGRKDGRKGIPPLDQVEHAPYEMQLKQVGEENIKRVAQRWEALDQRLKGEYCSAREALLAGQDRLPEAEEGYRLASEEHDAARKALRETPGHIELGPVGYWLIMSVIAIGEFPLNALVFRLFGEAEVMTYLMSATLAIVLPGCGHFLGILLKRRPLREGIFAPDAILTTLVALGPVAVILGIGYLREKYVEALEVQRLLGVHMDPTKVTFVFVAINLLIFLTATLASFLAHDAAIREAKKELKVAERRLREAQARLTAVRSAADGTAQRFQQGKANREATWEKKRNEAKEIRDIVQRLIEVYRTHNLRVRGSPSMPKSFTSYPTIKVAPVLEELDWECPRLDGQSATTRPVPGPRDVEEKAG